MKSGKSISLIKSGQQLFDILASHGEGKYILKKVAGSHGTGIMRITFKDGSIVDDNALTINTELLFSNLVRKQSSYILQKSLLTHQALKKIMPCVGLGTARIVTINFDDEIKIFAACVRIPVGKNIADNFAGGEEIGNLVAGIDLNTHRLFKPYGPDPFGLNLVENVDTHPDNGAIIEGFEFPYWEDMIQTAIMGAKAFSGLRTIGWDVALTEDGPSLIEANWRYDCDLLQVALNEGLKVKLTNELIR